MKDVLSNFGVNDNAKCNSFGEGLINNTFLVVSSKGKYILQKLNTNVFSVPESIASNLELLYRNDSNQLLVPAIRSENDSIFYVDENRDYWRMNVFVENAVAFQKIEHLYQAEVAAKAFANFLNLTNPIPVSDVKTIIPDFHNSITRWNQFELAIESANEKRKKMSHEAIKKTYAFKYIFDDANKLIEKSPLLVTHNDTKINNVLIDPKKKAFKNVIDLDTVMPGYLMYDFGDMVRTMASSRAENDKNISKVNFRIDVFEQLCKGFSSVYTQKLTEYEKASLTYSGGYMALIMGVRFLTDFLNNDVYYQTSYEEENLYRSLNQLKLIDSMTYSNSSMEKLVKLYF
ncbi:MAG: aminoglycoside phosphotransferase family protein [Cyclobacteriaceae bacterium]|nr:aminoglycoside phosphotransferase family protein [Cyclobacteriaceae bacterium]